ncbi:SGNH/GDSL hydrolase family protein [Neorhizobium alkalisoli]|uniref:SGNH/GDSL hydrolase family protein n=1 Tax=Neorhizobium alkalisoli TaxID=528178 RepID=UPI000CF86E4A|nr:SGNH/GDSL hydrolase family protein [Neorhizobium alkalisoli]
MHAFPYSSATFAYERADGKIGVHAGEYVAPDITLDADNIYSTLKRIGDNTTNVDMAGDTKFRYPGVPNGVLIPATVNSRVTGAMMPGGVAQSRRWDMQVEFTTSSRYVALYWVPPSATPRLLILVNGKWVSPSFTVTAAAGSTSNVLLTFPDNRSRTIKFIMAGGNNILNFQTEAAYPPVRSAASGKTLVTIGDSLTAGSGSPPTGASFLDTWAHGIAAMLGFDHCCNASIGGTKWVASGTGDVAISHFGGDRLPLALNISPEAIVFAGSRNDSAVDQAALDAITAAVSAALDVTPVTKRFVMGTFTTLPQNAAVQAGVLTEGVTFIDMMDGLQPEDIGADTVHPTYQGQINLRNRMAPRLFAAGCLPA